MPFDYKFRNFRNEDKWNGNLYLTRLSLACVAGGMREQASGGGATLFHRGRRPRGIHQRRSRLRNQNKSRQLRRLGCPLFRNLYELKIFYSALASCFGRDHGDVFRCRCGVCKISAVVVYKKSRCRLISVPFASIVVI